MRLPIVEFIDANARKPDRGALALVAAVLVFSSVILSLPFSESMRRAALARFQLARWPFVAWVVFQPLPSMYNFENQWEVMRAPDGDLCQTPIEGFINHHVYNPLLPLDWPLPLARFPAPARVLFRSTYMGTTVATAYRLDSGPGDRGLVVTPMAGP